MKQLSKADLSRVSGGVSTETLYGTAASMYIGSYVTAGLQPLVGAAAGLSAVPYAGRLFAPIIVGTLSLTALSAPFVAAGLYLDNQGELDNTLDYFNSFIPYKYFS